MAIDSRRGCTYNEPALAVDDRGVVMRESPHEAETRLGATALDDYVEFWPAGTFATGRFRCAACDNIVSVREVLPRCMLCGQRLWERAEQVPFPESRH